MKPQKKHTLPISEKEKSLANSIYNSHEAFFKDKLPLSNHQGSSDHTKLQLNVLPASEKEKSPAAVCNNHGTFFNKKLELFNHQGNSTSVEEHTASSELRDNITQNGQ